MLMNDHTARRVYPTNISGTSRNVIEVIIQQWPQIRKSQYYCTQHTSSLSHSEAHSTEATVDERTNSKGSPRPARNIRSGGDGDNFAQVSRGLRQRDSRGYPHQRDSFVVAFATMYSSSDEEEALLLLALEDEEISRFVFLSDRCRSYIIFFPP